MSDDIHFEEPAYPCPVAVGDEVVVTGLLCGKYEVGGTLILDGFTNKACVVTRSFWDYETGWRFVGRLVDEADIQAVRQLGTTGRTAEEYRERYPANPDLAESTAKALSEYDPAVVYFSGLSDF